MSQNKLKSLRVTQSKDDDGGVVNAYIKCCVSDDMHVGVCDGVFGDVSVGEGFGRVKLLILSCFGD